MRALNKTPLCSRQEPLWPRAPYTQRDRNEAVERGLEFIGEAAGSKETFCSHGTDLLWCFYTISTTAKNERIRALAARIGRERAGQWKREQNQIPIYDPDKLKDFVFGVDVSERLLGVHDQALANHLQKVTSCFSAADFLEFDPLVEGPPNDLPEKCEQCNRRNSRGATECNSCRAPLTFYSPYELWQDALVATYTGETYGVKLGASYADVIRWISIMRPYPTPAQLRKDEDSFHYVTYAITHLIYTLNNYGRYRLSPDWLPQEFNYLSFNLMQAIEFKNGEILGEFLDTLRAFGRDEHDTSIRAAVEYLLSSQNDDGSWGNMKDDIYDRYHTTWTAVDGLREYAYKGERLLFPRLTQLIG